MESAVLVLAASDMSRSDLGSTGKWSCFMLNNSLLGYDCHGDLVMELSACVSCCSSSLVGSTSELLYERVDMQ